MFKTLASLTLAILTTSASFFSSAAFAGDGIAIECKTADGAFKASAKLFVSSEGTVYWNDYKVQLNAKPLIEDKAPRVYALPGQDFFHDVSQAKPTTFRSNGKIVAQVRFVSTGKTLSVKEMSCQRETTRVQNLEVIFVGDKAPKKLKCIETKDDGLCG